MRFSVLAGFVIAFVGPATSASQPVQRIPVSIRLVGDDGLTQKLKAGLRNDVQRHSALRLATPADRDAISIESDRNVGWDRLSGKTVLIYTVYVFRGEKRGASHTGICFESGISKCVDAITRLARIAADRP